MLFNRINPALIDRIKAAIAVNPEITGAELADQLFVSRQRIYQVASKYGLKFPRARPKITMPQPPINTGSPLINISQTCCGTVSELIVAADLVARGFKPYFPIVRQKSYDIIAVNDRNEIFSVEVRTGRRLDKIVAYNKQVTFKSDIMAIVVKGEPVFYEPELS